MKSSKRGFRNAAPFSRWRSARLKPLQLPVHLEIGCIELFTGLGQALAVSHQQISVPAIRQRSGNPDANIGTVATTIPFSAIAGGVARRSHRTAHVLGIQDSPCLCPSLATSRACSIAAQDRGQTSIVVLSWRLAEMSQQNGRRVAQVAVSPSAASTRWRQRSSAVIEIVTVRDYELD